MLVNVPAGQYRLSITTGIYHGNFWILLAFYLPSLLALAALCWQLGRKFRLR
jgi:hypothetical protein